MRSEANPNEGQALPVSQDSHEEVVTHITFWNVIIVLVQDMSNQGVAPPQVPTLAISIQDFMRMNSPESMDLKWMKTLKSSMMRPIVAIRRVSPNEKIELVGYQLNGVA